MGFSCGKGGDTSLGLSAYSCLVSKFLCDRAHSYKWMYKPVAKVDESLVCFLEISKYLQKTLGLYLFFFWSLVVRCVITPTFRFIQQRFLHFHCKLALCSVGRKRVFHWSIPLTDFEWDTLCHRHYSASMKPKRSLAWAEQLQRFLFPPLNY